MGEIKIYRKKATVQAEPMTLKGFVELFPNTSYRPSMNDLGYHVISEGYEDWHPKEAFENDFEGVR